MSATSDAAVRTLPAYAPPLFLGSRGSNSDRLRLLTKLDMSGGADSCWPFTGARKPTGYGNFYFQGRVIGAHVAAFLLFIGDVPPDKEVDHVCHDPLTCLGGHTCPHRPCGNPRHLAAATHRENDMRSALGVSAVNAAKTHCLAGHEYTSENTYRAPASPSERHCRNCRAIRG